MQERNSYQHLSDEVVGRNYFTESESLEVPRLIMEEEFDTVEFPRLIMEDESDTVEVPRLIMQDQLVPMEEMIPYHDSILDLFPIEIWRKIFESLLLVNDSWRDVIKFILLSRDTYTLINEKYSDDVLVTIQTNNGKCSVPFEYIKNILMANYFFELNVEHRMRSVRASIDNLKQSYPCHEPCSCAITCCGLIQCCCVSTLCVGGAVALTFGLFGGVFYGFYSLFNSASCTMCVDIPVKGHIFGATISSGCVTVGVDYGLYVCCSENSMRCWADSVKNPCCDPCDNQYVTSKLSDLDSELENLRVMRFRYDVKFLTGSTQHRFFKANEVLGGFREKSRVSISTNQAISIFKG